MTSDRVWDMHRCGVHTECRYTPRRHNDGSPRKCYLAGKVERFHSHDFDGALWAACGCSDGEGMW